MNAPQPGASHVDETISIFSRRVTIMPTTKLFSCNNEKISQNMPVDGGHTCDAETCPSFDCCWRKVIKWLFNENNDSPKDTLRCTEGAHFKFIVVENWFTSGWFCAGSRALLCVHRKTSVRGVHRGFCLSWLERLIVVYYYSLYVWWTQVIILMSYKPNKFTELIHSQN